MIFSRVNAAPPPLIQALMRIAFIRAVDIQRQRTGGVEIEHGMPCFFSCAVDCSELDTAPWIRSLMPASASIKNATVEPVRRRQWRRLRRIEWPPRLRCAFHDCCSWHHHYFKTRMIVDLTPHRIMDGVWQALRGLAGRVASSSRTAGQVGSKRRRNAFPIPATALAPGPAAMGGLAAHPRLVFRTRRWLCCWRVGH